ncbi:DUF308 domain-containing protein [Enterococcus faecalis]|uniref:HdeD family acid-resistance protein n=1 Tax=Enterococcus faecalis TaxID=1351 RepID=UPI0039773DAC
MFQTFRENFRRHTLLRDAVFIVIGSAIVFNPGAFFQFVGYLIAGYLMLLGLINIYDDYKIKNKRVAGAWFRNRFNLCRLSSSLFIFAPVIVSILPFLLGISIVINGLVQLTFALNTRQTGALIYSILVLIAGAVLVFNPFKSLLVLMQVFGFILIFMGVIEIIGHFRNKA